MTDRRRALVWAATSTRLVVGAAVAAAVVLAVVLAIAAPWPTRAAQPEAVTATPSPADTVAACTGGLLALGRESTNAAQVGYAAAQTVVSSAGDTTLRSDRLSRTPAVTDDPGTEVFLASPSGGIPADIAAAGSSAVEAEDLRGFAASACRAPQMESWLVGGATTTGAADLLLLANPGDVPASVDITVYGPSGPATPTGAGGIVVAPGTQRVVPLAGIQIGLEAPVLRVTASGAPVTASLETTLTRTLLAGGVDQVGAIVSASSEAVIPGVTVTANAAAITTGGTTLVRLLAPQAATSAVVTVEDTSGTRVSTQTVPMEAGIPAAVELAGLAAGTYTVRVAADSPLVAAVWQTTSLGQGADFAWYPMAPSVSGETLVAVPDGPAPTLVAAAGSAAAEVTLTPVEGPGAAVELSVDADDSASVNLVAGTVYRMATTEPVSAMVSFADQGSLAGIPVWPTDAAASVLTVRP